ncbi:hypothetical protein [Muricoccus aerilatus]|uniref:hypothetical protein n=1 Tax=Muricoccus aerilatus TaxID=452982 RepID=UPI0005C1D350|nr:hypothetical protein [Roseomonas aerilata]
MPEDPVRSRDEILRDAVAERSNVAAPPGMAERPHRAPRGVAHPEEVTDKRGEWWTLVKAILIAAAVIMLIGWLISP